MVIYVTFLIYGNVWKVDLIKSNSISQISVYDATDKEWKNSHSDKDFTPDVRKTPEWKASLEKNLKNDNLRRSYEASKVFSTEVDKEIDRRKKANTQLATEEITLQPAVDQLREQVKDIIKLPDELKRIEGAQRVVGMIKSVATKIDLSRQKDLKNEFLTLQGTLYKTPAEFNQAFDLNEDLFRFLIF